MRNRTWGMKARVLTLVTVPPFIFLLIFVLFIQREISLHQEEFEDHGHMIASQVAIASEYGALTENMDTLREAIRSVIEIRDVEGVVILDSKQEDYVSQGDIQLIQDTPDAFQQPYVCHRDDALFIFCAPIFYIP